MPDIEEAIKGIQAILNLIFEGGQIPPWILRTIGILLAIWGLLFILSRIKDLWLEHFWPMFYDAEKKRQSVRHQRFADHIEGEIRRVNILEEWRDYRFAELEAEVEAEGRRRTFTLLPFLQRTRSGLRREKSLSKALEVSRERLILLEGDPGSGKSVALRHVAQSMARKAMRARSIKSIIPIYVNLKELERSSNQEIDRQLIDDFVLKTLNRVNDRDIEVFLEDEFDEGLRNGTWLFLFDSFDELPEVLSSTEADTAIRSYADAISDFLGGMNQCRGIIASRHFRGPGQTSWPSFRILPLSESRRLELIRKADLKPEIENKLVGELGAARHGMQMMASNPMFLGLLCEYMRAENPFPENAHIVFETYIGTRLTRDKERVQRRFDLEIADLRETAEQVAFCMSTDLGLGLSPTRDQLKKAMLRLGFTANEKFDPETKFYNVDNIRALLVEAFTDEELRCLCYDTQDFRTIYNQFDQNTSKVQVINQLIEHAGKKSQFQMLLASAKKHNLLVYEKYLPYVDFAARPTTITNFDTYLDALEYIKLARSETAITVGEAKSFTFAHRRFQEYFATCVVLREPDLVPPKQLLTDARWRETAVVMCQTQPPAVLSSLTQEAQHMLAEIVNNIPGLIDNPIEYVATSGFGDEETRDRMDETLPELFPWPPHLLHLLNLLQDGFSSHLEDLPDDIRLCAGQMILSANVKGTLSDKKWGLEVAGIIPQPILLWLLREAFTSSSQWLREVAYRQAAQLGKIPDDIATSIRLALLDLFANDRLRHERHATHAHLTRLDQSTDFLAVLNRLLLIPYIDRCLYIILFAALASGFIQKGSSSPLQDMMIIFVLLFSYLGLRRGYAYILSKTQKIPGRGYVILNIDESIILITLILWVVSLQPVVFSALTSRISLFLLILLMFWTPLTLLSARTGHLIRPFWWFLVLLWPLFYFVQDLIDGFVWFKRNWKNLPILLLRIINPIIKTVIGFAIFFIGLLLLVLPLGLIAAWLDLVLWGRDIHKWQKWTSNRQAAIAGEESLEVLGQYYHNTLRLKFIRIVRKQALLITTKQTQTLLKNLAIAIERDQKLQRLQKRKIRKLLKEKPIKWGIEELKFEASNLMRELYWVTQTKYIQKTISEDSNLQNQELDVHSQSNKFNLWYNCYIIKDKQKLGKWGSEILDEVSKLLEQVRANM